MNSISEDIKANVPTINQERALVGAFPMIVKTDGSFAALPVALVTIMTSDPDIHVEGVVPAALVV